MTDKDNEKACIAVTVLHAEKLLLTLNSELHEFYKILNTHSYYLVTCIY